MDLVHAAQLSTVASGSRLEQKVVLPDAVVVVAHVAAVGIAEVERVEWRRADAADPRAESVGNADLFEQRRRIIDDAVGCDPSLEHHLSKRSVNRAKIRLSRKGI